MAEFESKVFKSLESLQGSSKSAMTCEPAELQAFRDTWIAISTSKEFQKLFKNGNSAENSYVSEIETAMKGPTSEKEKIALKEDDAFKREMGNTVDGFPIKNNAQKDSLERLKLVGASMNLFRRVKDGQPEVKNDGFREAVEKELTARLEKAYEGQDVDIQEKVKIGGDVLNEALSGEQTDLCSFIAGGLPPGLVIGAYPKILEENGKDSQLRVVYQTDPSYELSNEEKKTQVDKLYGRGKTTEFKATNLGDTIGSFKPLYERKDGSWVVELKEPGFFTKGQVAVLTEGHLAGRKLEANKKMDGFTMGAVEQIKIKRNLKNEQTPSSGIAQMSMENFIKMNGSAEEISAFEKERTAQTKPSLSVDTPRPSTSSSNASSLMSTDSTLTRMSEADFLAKFGTDEDRAKLGASHVNRSTMSFASSSSQASSQSSVFDEGASVVSSQTSASIHEAASTPARASPSSTQDPRIAIENACQLGVPNCKLTPTQYGQLTQNFILKNNQLQGQGKPRMEVEKFLENALPNRWNPKAAKEFLDAKATSKGASAQAPDNQLSTQPEKKSYKR
ncbi:MAG: hypothetical protein V4568_06815 [Pseudomonadota bacterium]